MRVRCVANRYNEDTRAQLHAVGIFLHRSVDLQASLVVGNGYLFVRLRFLFGVPPSEAGPYVVIVPEVGPLLEVPLALVEVSNPHVSRIWQLHTVVDRDEGITEITLGPPSFLGNFTDYMEQVERGEPPMVADFVRTIEMLRGEESA